MTRSEIEKAIERGEWRMKLIKASDPNGAGGVGIKECRETWERKDAEEFVTVVLDLLLAEQKRSEGCAYCAGNALDDYVLENMNGKYPKVLTRLAVANGHGTNQHAFSFCPNCGARPDGGRERMTNYERICADKAFCAATIADVIGEDFFDKTMEWLDMEQREVIDERAQEVNQ